MKTGDLQASPFIHQTIIVGSSGSYDGSVKGRAAILRLTQSEEDTTIRGNGKYEISLSSADDISL
jgi:hypothetical protein